MQTQLLRQFLIGCLLFLGGGCNLIPATNAPEAPVHPSAAATAMTETPIQENPMETEPSLPIPSIPGLPTLIEKAKEDLAQRLSIPASEITLLEATSVVWSDGSLGCPQEGMEYAQVLTPGYLIRFKAGDQEFEYHASRGNTVIFCENPAPHVPGTPADI